MARINLNEYLKLFQTVSIKSFIKWVCFFKVYSSLEINFKIKIEIEFICVKRVKISFSKSPSGDLNGSYQLLIENMYQIQLGYHIKYKLIFEEIGFKLCLWKIRINWLKVVIFEYFRFVLIHEIWWFDVSLNLFL